MSGRWLEHGFAIARAEDRERTARSGYPMHLARPAEAALYRGGGDLVAGKR
jgi:hypothetical protein